VQCLGLNWFRGLADHCCRLADYAQARLERSPRFEVVSPRRLSIVGFRAVAPERTADDAEMDRLNLLLVERLRETGRAFLSSTRLRGRVVLRFCFVNWRTSADDVDEVVELLNTLWEEVLQSRR
jgi:glutamate/tyrosine decarboxylase-like PLP-dependent enzyme